NVQGTQTVLESSQKAQLKQFIHISSLSVITGQGDQFDVDETAPLRFCGENYADSKASAEQMLRDKMSEAGTMPITILRPGFIYGPYEKTWMP
ncbi:NAD-dependent epimerase/dehydratase family protein, partial [Escherichia coli]